MLVPFMVGLAPPQQAVGLDEQALELRREYNLVVATMDSLLRLYGHDKVAELAAVKPEATGIMASDDLVLIFWADDEAQVFLNGFLVGQTRLTPVQVEIPQFYLRQENVLSAHCWDTDRVVYGFMAGLYLRDSSGSLRRVAVTDEDSWTSEGAPTVPSYPPTFSQPDIPGARVIWRQDQNYGSVRLETSFTMDQVRRAAHQNRRSPTQLQVTESPMIFNEVVARIAHLKKRQGEVAEALHRRSSSSALPVRYRGFARSDLALTLGHAGRLSEELSLNTASELTAWAHQLPVSDRGLVFRDPRQLKGLAEATAGVFEPTDAMKEDEEDRRLDYQPPPERGAGSWVLETRMVPIPSIPVAPPWKFGLLSVGLMLYSAVVGRKSWSIYRDEVWKR